MCSVPPRVQLPAHFIATARETFESSSTRCQRIRMRFSPCFSFETAWCWAIRPLWTVVLRLYSPCWLVEVIVSRVSSNVAYAWEGPARACYSAGSPRFSDSSGLLCLVAAVCAQCLVWCGARCPRRPLLAATNSSSCVFGRARPLWLFLPRRGLRATRR